MNKLKKGDIVEKGTGIAIIREINGEVATLSYLERNLPSMTTWTNRIDKLNYICSPRELKDIIIPTEFREQIRNRDVELSKIQMENVRRLEEKQSRSSKKKEKTEEQKKMGKLLEKLTPSQILELLE